jgi:DNA polymerase-3 subunit delta'
MSFTVTKAFDLIAAAHERERLAHAFLITGPKGSGKEELAAKMAHLLNGRKDEGADLWGDPVEEVSPALDEQEGEYIRVVRPRSKSRLIAVDDIRALEKMMNQSSPDRVWKIGVIVDADRMNDSSANAFLKTLEEPPRESLLLLLSSEPERLLTTIWSRCVHISLAATPGAEKPEQVQRILPLLESVTRDGIGRLESGLAVKAGLEDLLRQRKVEIEKKYALVFKEEKTKYQKIVDAKWMDDREKIHLAQASADYLGERALMIETIHAWVGDLLRQKVGGKGLEFPEYAGVMASAVENEDLDVLLRRVAAMEELRRLLETNVVEALALEVSLMNTFGKISA